MFENIPSVPTSSVFRGKWVGPAARLLKRPLISEIGTTDRRFEWFTREFRQYMGAHVGNLEELIDLLTSSDDVVELIGTARVAELLIRLEEYVDFIFDMSLEEELFSILASVADAHSVPILADHFGWSGRPEHNSRVQSQVQQQYEETSLVDKTAMLAQVAIREGKFWTPSLDRALKEITEHDSCETNAIGSRLYAAGITEYESIDGVALRLACELLGKPVPSLLWDDNGTWTPGDEPLEVMATDLQCEMHQDHVDYPQIYSESPAQLPSLTTKPRPLSALAQLAAWAALQHGANTLEELMAIVRQGDGLPGEIKHAWASLMDADTLEVGAEFLTRYDAISSFKCIQDHFGDDLGTQGLHPNAEVARRWRILLQRILPTKEPATLHELGQELGVTRERVRQIETKVRQRLCELISTPASRAVVYAAAQLRRRMGAAFPVEDLSSHLILRFDIHPDMASMKDAIEQLILWVAGPYKERTPGWLVCEAESNLPSATIAVLHSATQSGPIPKEEGIEAIEDLGVVTRYAERWISQTGRFRFVDGWLVRWSGSFADKAEHLLLLGGEPLTREEIGERVAGSVSRGSIQQLYADERFMRTSRIHIGLRIWGLEEYSSIEEEIAQEIDRQEGKASSDHLIATLTTNFHVAESSVRAYLSNSPNFSLTSEGYYVNRPRASSARGIRPIERSRSCFRIGNHWAHKVQVTPDILRGSGSGISTAFAAYVGAGVPGAKVQFPSPVGPITIANTPTGSTISSLRAAVNSSGASEGDALFVQFVERDKFDFHSVSRSRLDDARGLARLALEVGIVGDAEPAMLSSVARAIGLASNATLDEVRRRFIQRREPELAELLPSEHEDGPPVNGTNHAEGDVLTEFLRSI